MGKAPPLTMLAGIQVRSYGDLRPVLLAVPGVTAYDISERSVWK